MLLTAPPTTYSKDLLARSIQTFDDLLEGRDGSKNHEQCLLLAHKLREGANSQAATAAFFGFLGVGFIVISVVLAVVIDPVLLLLLVNTAVCFPLSVHAGMESLEISKTKEALTSFTEVGKGFFARDEPEKEAEKGSWSDRSPRNLPFSV